MYRAMNGESHYQISIINNLNRFFTINLKNLVLNKRQFCCKLQLLLMISHKLCKQPLKWRRDTTLIVFLRVCEVILKKLCEIGGNFHE